MDDRYRAEVIGLARWQPTLLHIFESTSGASGYSLDDLTDGFARGGPQSLRYGRRVGAVVAHDIGCPVAILSVWLGVSHRTAHQWVTPGNYQRDRVHPRSVELVYEAMTPTFLRVVEP